MKFHFNPLCQSQNVVHCYGTYMIDSSIGPNQNRHINFFYSDYDLYKLKMCIWLRKTLNMPSCHNFSNYSNHERVLIGDLQQSIDNEENIEI